MTSAIVPVTFHHQTIDCIQEDGEIFVSVRKICDNLGLDHSRQLRKLKASGWAVVVMMSTTGSDGKRYEMASLPLEHLPMWLATIHASKVAESVRPALLRYQCKVRNVLAEHFGLSGQLTATKPRKLEEDYAALKAMQLLITRTARGLCMTFGALAPKLAAALDLKSYSHMTMDQIPEAQAYLARAMVDTTRRLAEMSEEERVQREGEAIFDAVMGLSKTKKTSKLKLVASN